MVNIVNHITLINYKSAFILVYFWFTMFIMRKFSMIKQSKHGKPCKLSLTNMITKSLTANCPLLRFTCVNHCIRLIINNLNIFGLPGLPCLP
jgi:hypothetical protein